SSFGCDTVLLGRLVVVVVVVWGTKQETCTCDFTRRHVVVTQSAFKSVSPQRAAPSRRGPSGRLVHVSSPEVEPTCAAAAAAASSSSSGCEERVAASRRPGESAAARFLSGDASAFSCPSSASSGTHFRRVASLRRARRPRTRSRWKPRGSPAQRDDEAPAAEAQPARAARRLLRAGDAAGDDPRAARPRRGSDRSAAAEVRLRFARRAQQVHNRPQYLRLLVASLEKAAEVHGFLLIFSHDHFSEEINAIVQGVTFCRVLQIYFPFSTQLYPAEFPGKDPRDCPRDMSKDNALKTRCLNAAHPDAYGHYREAFITQTKHHWWWKLHFVWERVQAVQGYGGFVIFLEEDNYVLPDLFHYYKSMIEFRKGGCPDCDMLALGNHDALTDFTTLSNKVSTTGWMSTKHNLGMAISREVYYKLMGCNSEYCTYDDYNWDWTLQHLSGTCISKPVKVLAAQASRVLHTGDCGLHQKEDCRPEWASRKVEEALLAAKDGLFPPSLVLKGAEAAEHKAHVKNGGWGDVRDHVLCKNYAKVL
uniref:Si:ch73-91k6.2 n=1 Tax=Gasterosteus aculeatus aculeatus TaxID=481459 RepID=A0AAQ4NYG8_GASAC